MHASGNPHLEFMPRQGVLNPGETQTLKVGGSFDAELLPQNFWFTISSPESMRANTITLYCRN